MFLICNPVSQLIFFAHYILSSTIFFASAHQSTPSPRPVHFLYSLTLVYFVSSSREEAGKFLQFLNKKILLPLDLWIIFLSFKEKSKFYSQY